MDTTHSFGSWLSQRRKALDLTQMDLADQVGCSVATIQKIEQDLRRPSRQVSELLADILAIAQNERAAFVAFARRSTPGQPVPGVPVQRLTAHNLPVQPTSFIGREAELRRLASYLVDPDCRLLTLVGPGGIGKTRLALEVAAWKIGDYEQGVYFVSLAPVNSPDLIAPSIADALHISLHGSEDHAVYLVNCLREKHLLLILDNVEHLLEGRELFVNLLANAPQVKLLVTSRERLDLREEWVLPVHGLTFPPRNTASSVEAYEAVQLFLQLARRIEPAFSLVDDPEGVMAICRAVEGMPLALELAAPWLRIMPCRQVAEQIERNLDFLTTTRLNMPERHQSLRAVFDHSWSLLTETERRVLAALSIFHGGFDLVAAESVAEGSLPILARLVDQSLIRALPAGRYDLHQRLRQYAADKLVVCNATASIARRHLGYFLSLAEQAGPQLHGPDQVAWFDRLQPELDNFRAALTWSVQTEPAIGLQLAIALGSFWEATDYWQEGCTWLERLLSLNADAPLAVQAKGLQVAGELAGYVPGRNEHAVTLLGRALPLAREVGDLRIVAWTLGALGPYLDVQREGKRAVALLEEALALFQQMGDDRATSHMLNRLSIVVASQGAYARAIAYAEEALALARKASDLGVMAWAFYLAGNAEWLKDNEPGRALVLFQQSLPLFRETRNRLGITEVLFCMGVAERAQGHVEQAEAFCKESLVLARDLGDEWRIAICLACLGCVASDCKSPLRAAILLSAAKGLEKVESIRKLRSNHIDFDVEVAALRSQLDPVDFMAAWAKGQAMTLAQAIVYGLEGS